MQRRFGFDQPLCLEDILAVMPRNGGFVSRREIAAALMRKKSPTLLAWLQECVNAGLLKVQLIPLPNKVDMYTYALSDLAREEMYRVSGEDPSWLQPTG